MDRRPHEAHAALNGKPPANFPDHRRGTGFASAGER